MGVRVTGRRSAAASDGNSGKKRKIVEDKQQVSNLYITEELALKILSKLPIKSAKRFTCVQKSWLDLFETPYFLTMFAQNFVSKKHLMYEDTSYLCFDGEDCTAFLLSGENLENKVDLDLPTQFAPRPGATLDEIDDNPLKILGSAINGIICLYNYVEGIIPQIVLCSPATRQFWVLPVDLNFHVYPINLHGFGYDHVEDDYKVICYLELDFDSEFEDDPDQPIWLIYSHRSDTWKELDIDMLPRTTWTGHCNEVYLDGVCHWIGGEGDDECLVSFNLSTETFITTSLPSRDVNDTSRCHLCKELMVLNGSLALIYYGQNFHISVLAELGVDESWTKLIVEAPLDSIQYPSGPIVLGEKGHIFSTELYDEDYSDESGEDDDIIEDYGEFNIEYVLCSNLSTKTCEQLDVFDGRLNEIVIYKENFRGIRGYNY